MSELFLSLLNMSFTASYVIIFVIFVRLLLKKAPKFISYALWGVVAFRLVIPFSFESMFSLMPRNKNAIPITQDIIYQQSPQINSGIGAVDSFVNQLLPIPTTGASVNPLQIYVEIGTYIWILGIAALLVYSFVSILKLKKQLKNAAWIETNIFEAKNLKTPFVLGLIKPKIYLPTELDDDERAYILLHEKTHINRKDHVIKIVAFFVLCIHWFNPLVWIAFILMSTDMELSCDEKVLKEMNQDIKKSYANSLFALATGRHVLNGSPLAFSEGNVKGRIKNVLNYKKPKLWVVAITMILAIVVTIGLIANPTSAAKLSDVEVEPLTGYIVIKDNILHFDEVEIVEWEDQERVKELDLDLQNDMPSGYAIINENQEERIYVLADEVEYMFTDLNLNFTKEPEGDRIYTTTKLKEFLQHLGEYDLNEVSLSEQTIPYFIKVQDGKVISIEEKLKYTI